MDGVFDLTVSAGVAGCAPMQKESPDLLVRRADRDLYRAKQAGRNRVGGDVGNRVLIN